MLRSYALGVALLSKCPCRPAVQPLPELMATSCRISEGFVRLNCLEVKIISVYGVPRCLPEATSKNNLLLAWAYQRATVSCVPTIVAGDFNTCPTELPAWQAFQDLGWVELGAFAAQVHDIHLPCTCKGATRFDTFLLPPSMFQFFSSADVLAEDHLFDSHAPMRLHLHMPGSKPARWIWPLPRTFNGLLLEPSSLAPVYNSVAAPLALAFQDSTPEASPGDKLRLWSVAVEESVSKALHLEYHAAGGRQTLRGLPKAYSGRCKPVHRVKAQPPSLPRQGRNGDPKPFDEDTSVLGRQRLRQLRRLVTFAQGLDKYHKGKYKGPLGPDGWPVSLDKEWAAIVGASGYGRHFPRWVLQWPCFPVFPLLRPDAEFVADLTSFIRYDTEALQKQQVATKCKTFKFKLHVDAHEFGGARSFVRVKPAGKPPFTCVKVTSSQPAQVRTRHNHHLWQLQVPDVSKFELHCPVSYAQVAGQITSTIDNCVMVLFPADDDCVLPSNGLLCRCKHESSWSAVVGSLMDFWAPIWNRDNSEEAADISCWPRYQQLVHLLRSPCPEIEVDLTDVGAWVHVARKLSSSKATGPCGWHNQDLKLLPASALGDLSKVLNSYVSTGFPHDIMMARVAVLSKVASPEGADQALVEESLLSGSDLSGFCLDLRKAFNFLPRVRRSFQINGSLGPPVPSTTGAPEGDPVSVLAMIAVCWLYVALLEGLVAPKAYVDNLSWTADAPDNHAPAMLVLNDFVQALSLHIDWGKTYQWATTPVSKRWWQEIGVAFLPSPEALHLVSQVKELGSFYQFRRRGSAQLFGERLQDAHQRLQALSTDPQALPTRAKIVQGGIWPFLFFGTEALLPSATAMQQLHGAAARAIVGPHHTLSAFAALGLLPNVQDPEVYLLCHHLSQLKRAFRVSPDAAFLVWDRLLGEQLSSRATCGPAGALQALLRRNGWSFDDTGTFKGPLHCQFSLFSFSMRQIRDVIELAWADNIQDQVLHRNGMTAAPVPHVHLTAQVLRGFKPWEQQYVARHFCGGFMSGAEKQTWSRMDTEHCPLCGEVDTKGHRIFSCVALESKREPYRACLAQVQANHAHWVHMPYVAWPFEASVLQLLLAKFRLPEPAPAPLCSRITIFTDASAINTQCPTSRVTTWAVVVGSCPKAPTDLLPSDLQGDCLLSNFSVVAQGCTPGPQTVPRAELAALAWTSRWLSGATDICATVYSDCQPAINLWNKWVNHGWLAISGAANSDLLRDLPRPRNFLTVKIKAHRSAQELQQLSLWDQWLAAGNNAADVAAKAARANLSAALLDMAATTARKCEEERVLLKSFCRALLDMGVFEAKQRQSTGASQATAESCDWQTFLSRARSWQMPQPRLLPFPETWEEDWSNWPFGVEYGTKLIGWLQQLSWPVPPAVPAHSWQITYLELSRSRARDWTQGLFYLVQRFAKLFWYGVEGRFSCLVMEMLGYSLEERLQGCGGTFTAPTCVLVADQCLRRIEYLHSCGMLHRDIKPENFVFRGSTGWAEEAAVITRYYDGKHANMRTNLSLTGTARYASINAHKGIEQSRRDDLEIDEHPDEHLAIDVRFEPHQLPYLGQTVAGTEENYPEDDLARASSVDEYARKSHTKMMQVYMNWLTAWDMDMAQDPIPWVLKEEKYRKIREKKAFRIYLATTRSLGFDERPDYRGLRKLFADLRTEIGPEEVYGL
ncbi:Casein kinase I-like hhp1 [Symbiodinium microadriaticum]|uniref:Casein kinase I n=1 Tax=Symbiodinium microadriaticum TaxID=2951 RepID=A0A1Q9DSC7_SYMMI|nr:Casein kinase I-like hhp1 [Symbiodinium microadriaticum]